MKTYLLALGFFFFLIGSMEAKPPLLALSVLEEVFVPVEKKKPVLKKKLKKTRKKKQFKRKTIKQTKQLNKPRPGYIIMIIGGALLALLSIALLVYGFVLAIMGGVAAIGIGYYFVWFGFALSFLAAFYLILAGLILIHAKPKKEKEVPEVIDEEQILEEATKKYENLPPESIAEYTKLSVELKELEAKLKAEKTEILKMSDFDYERLKNSIDKTEKEVTVKKATLERFADLNKELSDVSRENKLEYIALKEEMFVLQQELSALKEANNGLSKDRIQEIEGSLETKTEALKKLRED